MVTEHKGGNMGKDWKKEVEHEKGDGYRWDGPNEQNRTEEEKHFKGPQNAVFKIIGPNLLFSGDLHTYFGLTDEVRLL